jgi:hypothetical protein
VRSGGAETGLGVVGGVRVRLGGGGGFYMGHRKSQRLDHEIHGLQRSSWDLEGKWAGW